MRRMQRSRMKQPSSVVCNVHSESEFSKFLSPPLPRHRQILTGNWTAGIALMDRSALPRPALTLTTSLTTNFIKPTPANEPLVLRSKVVRIRDKGTPGAQRTSVEVEMSLFTTKDGLEELICSGSGVFKKQGESAEKRNSDTESMLWVQLNRHCNVKFKGS